MIDIKELSVGNWVYNKHHGKAIQITPFDFFTHTHIDGMQYLIENSKLVSGKDFEPIEITPEIMKKDGWNVNIGNRNPKMWVAFLEGKKAAVTLTHGKDGTFVIIIADSGEIRFALRYVHQLQNALTLCGINKEIEL